MLEHHPAPRPLPPLNRLPAGAILFEETLFQNTRSGQKMVDALAANGIVPGIKVDKGLHPLANSNGESWCAARGPVCSVRWGSSAGQRGGSSTGAARQARTARTCRSSLSRPLLLFSRPTPPA